MKKRYSIGEVASLLGISAQTLRFYSNQGLIKPRYIDERTGYRYYAYDQFHKIDRIKYLQGFGMNLGQIREALASGQVDDLKSHLEKHRDKKQRELASIAETVETMNWYINYYQYIQDNQFPDIPFKRKFPVRHFLSVPFVPGEPLFGPAGYRLAELKNKPPFRDLSFLRQHGYVLSFQALTEHRIEPECYFIYLKDTPDFEHPAIRTIPAGEFLCFQGRILSNDWNPELVNQYLPHLPASSLVVADEYEDNLKDFARDLYEIQILLKTMPLGGRREIAL